MSELRRGERSLPPRPRGIATAGLLGIGGLGLVFVSKACGGEPAPEIEAADPVRTDERVLKLLAPCAKGHFYDRNTGDAIGILIDKLRTGRGEPLKRAKEELGALGDRSIDALKRAVQRHYTSMAESPFLENAVDAVALNDSDGAHDLLLEALDHPMESVRSRAMMGLVTRPGRPEDFELFLARVTGSEPASLRSLYARAWFRSDPARAEEIALDWIEQGKHPELWLELVPRLLETESTEVRARAGRLFREVDPRFGLWLAVVAAAGGHAGAAEHLEAALEAEDPNARILAVQAIGSGGMSSLLPEVVRSDPDDKVRLLALEALGRKEEWTQEETELLRAGMDDRVPEMREVALKHLVARRDPAGVERALQLLGSENPAALQVALLALFDPVKEDPELAARVFDRLVERYSLESHRPLQERTATFKAVGMLPMPEAARMLRDAGIAAEGERIESLRAHDWLMIQAANTGAAGRETLLADLDTEEDPLRRIDLIVAAGAARDDAAREALVTILDEKVRTPYETLVAAERLAKLGPTDRVAPRLKRITHAMEPGEVRTAMQCLLWSWY